MMDEKRLLETLERRCNFAQRQQAQLDAVSRLLMRLLQMAGADAEPPVSPPALSFAEAFAQKRDLMELERMLGLDECK